MDQAALRMRARHGRLRDGGLHAGLDLPLPQARPLPTADEATGGARSEVRRVRAGSTCAVGPWSLPFDRLSQTRRINELLRLLELRRLRRGGRLRRRAGSGGWCDGAMRV